MTHTHARAAEVERPEHLQWAQSLVETVIPAANEYGGPAALTWAGANGLDHSTARAQCAPFVTRLLEQAYDIDTAAWFGCTSPHAATYHDIIEIEDGFTRIDGLGAVLPGDIVAIRYFTAGCQILGCGTFQGCTTTGHAAVVAAAPALRSPTAPLIAGTAQYAVDVFDASSTPHGVGDSRWQAGPGGAHDQGVGRGTLRLYVDTTDPERPIVGHTWTTSSGSTFYPQDQRDVVIGRYAA